MALRWVTFFMSEVPLYMQGLHPTKHSAHLHFLDVEEMLPRDISLIRKRPPPGPYSRTKPRAL